MADLLTGAVKSVLEEGIFTRGLEANIRLIEYAAQLDDCLGLINGAVIIGERLTPADRPRNPRILGKPERQGSGAPCISPGDRPASIVTLADPTHN
jgi:hypothetical protein